DRVFVGLLRHARLRRPAHARNRFSLSAILSAWRREDRPSRSTRRSDRAAGDGRRGRGGRRAYDNRGATAPPERESRQQPPPTRHRDQPGEPYRKAVKGVDGLAAGGAGKPPIHPQQVAKAISDHASEDAVFTCDVGLPTVWAARYLAMNGKRRLIGSFWHGSMANAMSQAIGAQAAFPRRQVISLSG